MENKNNVTSFPDPRIRDDITALNKYEGIFRGLGMPVPKMATTKDFYDYLFLPSTADTLAATIIFHIKKARGQHEVTN